MVGWLRDAARQVGHGDLWAPPLLDSLEAREYSQVPTQPVSSLILLKRTSSDTVDMKGSMSHIGQPCRQTFVLMSSFEDATIQHAQFRANSYFGHIEASQGAVRPFRIIAKYRWDSGLAESQRRDSGGGGRAHMRASSRSRHPQQRQAPGGLAATGDLRHLLSLASQGRRTSGKLFFTSVSPVHTAPPHSLCLLTALHLPIGFAVRRACAGRAALMQDSPSQHYLLRIAICG